MYYCDHTEKVVEWSSEEIAIPYRSPKDNRYHLYFPDFYMKVRNTNGSIQSYLVEVKPKAQVEGPSSSKEDQTIPNGGRDLCHQPSKMGSSEGILQGRLCSSKSSPNANSKFEHLITDLKGRKISKQKLREEVFNILYDNAVENVEEGNYYFFEYDPKFKSVLREWDQYPLIQVLEIKAIRFWVLTYII